jgi:hypothetical protein
VTSPITVNVSPDPVNVTAGQMQQFTVVVANAANPAVTWSLVGPATNGSINSVTGLYTAPGTPPAGTVTVVATSNQDPTKSDTATVTVVATEAVAVSPAKTRVTIGQTQQFTATVTGSATFSISWSVVGGAANGTINSTGLYMAPAAVPSPAVVTIMATDTLHGVSGMTTTTIQGVIAVSVSPPTVGVNVNTTQQFSATVANDPTNSGVTWSITPPATLSISATGLYTAPAVVPVPATVTVTATSIKDPTKMGTATITVQPVVSITILPTAMTVSPNQQVQFTATVAVSSNTAVNWTVNTIPLGNSTVGTISTSGLYIAPASVPSSPIVSVTATSVADPTKSASAGVTISAPSAGIFVIVGAKNRTLPLNRTQQYRSHVILSTNSSVNWTITGPSCAGAGNPCGTIDNTTNIGLWTPPATLPANPNITITATSQADPTKSDSANAVLAAGVFVTPVADSLHVTDSVQFSAQVTGVANTAVTWAVNGITGGSAALGLIDTNGLYTAPPTVPNPGMLEISATSVADPTQPGLANMKIYPPRFMKLFPKTISVLPGWRVIFQYSTNVYTPTTSSNFNQVVTWSVNGIVGGNASVGTITNAGVYTAPLTSMTVTVAAQSTVNPAFTANATVTVTPAAGSSSFTLIDTLTKVRPYDVVTGTPAISLAAAQQEYADWQVLLTGNGEDLSGADVTVSDFRDTSGNRISNSNAVIYLEKMLDIQYQSRSQGSDLGEWPDPIVPKVDPLVGEVRNAFPFTVNRISPAYRRYPLKGGNIANTGLGGGSAKSSGAYTGTVYERFDIFIDTAGAVGTATFRWSTDGGVTFRATGVKTSASPVTLADGVTVSFQPGTFAGIADFNLNDSFQILAGPLRNQPVWIDLYVPMGTPAGNYTGTVTVTAAGKSPALLTVNLQVYAFAIPVSSSFPVYFGSYWNAMEAAHYNQAFGSQAIGLGQLYGEACLINRLSCDGAFAPALTFNANGTVATYNPSGYDNEIAPLVNGTMAPHGEQWTTIKLALIGATETQQYFSTQAQLAHFVSQGWRSRLFDYTKDEPSVPADFTATTDRASLLHGVDPALRTLVTTAIPKFNFNLIGYISRWVPNWMALGQKEYQRGPSTAERAEYDQVIAKGDELFWYDSCTTHGCGNGNQVPFLDNYPNSMMDTPALENRVWGLMSLVPYRVTGVLYFDSTFGLLQSYNMGSPNIDTWDSIYYFGGNGDGTFFYPGRAAQKPFAAPGSAIGGTTDIPIESLRLKYDRDALVDIEYGLKLQAQGDSAFLESNVLTYTSDIYTYDADPALFRTLRNALGVKVK